MNVALDQRMDALLNLLRQIGSDGGALSASVYDTARSVSVLPAEGRISALRWLVAHQHEDGGWGSPEAPLARHIPTLSCVLALDSGPSSPEREHAMRRGLVFLRERASEWGQSLGDDIPVAAELILPRLLDEAARAGLDVSHESHSGLRSLGEHRRGLIRRMRPAAGTAPIHAWEAWGTEPTVDVLDGTGGVGHSPAATAAWLSLAAGSAGTEEAQSRARQYLDSAAAATREGTPGIVPTVWPIDGFERCWALYSLLLSGGISHPFLEDEITTLLDHLARALRPAGIGMSDHFIHDGDITSTTVAVLLGTRRAADISILERFRRGDHFFTYAHEVQPSITTTAHAVHALALAGRDVQAPIRWLESKQAHDGRWTGDKWHCSWLYTSAQVMSALAHAGASEPLTRAATAMLDHQREDGGWGMTRSTRTETAYAVLALHSVRPTGIHATAIPRALLGAARYLSTTPADSQRNLWIGKELYRPYRVDEAFELSAELLLASLESAETTGR